MKRFIHPKLILNIVITFIGKIMGICMSLPKANQTVLMRDDSGNLCEMTKIEPTRAEKKSMRKDAKDLKKQFESMGMKVTGTPTFTMTRYESK